MLPAAAVKVVSVPQSVVEEYSVPTRFEYVVPVLVMKEMPHLRTDRAQNRQADQVRE